MDKNTARSVGGCREAATGRLRRSRTPQSPSGKVTTVRRFAPSSLAPAVTGLALGAVSLCVALRAGIPVPAEAERSVRPLALNPSNPHYFQYRGKPAVLITSGEHYGAVLNQDFDFRRYLDELKRNRFNLTRTFSGVYMENPGAFNIKQNTLAPLPGRLLCPWARSSEAGYAGGGAKFDLTRWDEAYFRRLKEFVREADRRGVVVEYVLFCPYYDDAQWNLSPLKAGNNVNGIGAVPRTEALTLKHAELVAVEDAFVKKVVAELRDTKNVYFEICNEPYFGGVTLDWQAHLAGVIQQAEAERPVTSRHLIAQNIANKSAVVRDPNPAVSLFNFHYASPPEAVRVNYGLNRPIGFDESGFRGTTDLPYRTEAWEFLLAGGAVYNNLDYSYSTATPDGSGKVEAPTPGGGGPTLRRQLGILKEFVEGLPFTRMKPDPAVVRAGAPAGGAVHVLAEAGKAYGIYVRGGGLVTLELALPKGRYQAEWVNTLTGAVEKPETLDHRGEVLTIQSPAYREDIALRLRSVE